MSSQPYLFVYGTLKSTFRNRYARRLRREALLAGQATMPGRLYRIRWYPGMRPPRVSADVVTGELYRLRQPAKVLEVLDEYEDDYRRELHRATLSHADPAKPHRDLCQGQPLSKSLPKGIEEEGVRV